MSMKRILVILMVIAGSTMAIPVRSAPGWRYTRKEMLNLTWGTRDYQLDTDYFAFFDEAGEPIFGPEDGVDDLGSTITGPTTIAVAPSGAVCICDQSNHRLVLYSSKGVLLKSVDIDFVDAMCFDRKGNLYAGVSDHVDVYSPTLVYLRSFCYGSHNFSPTRMWLDETAGKIALTDYYHSFVVSYTAAGSRNNGSLIESKPYRICEMHPEINETKREDGRLTVDVTVLAPFTLTTEHYRFTSPYEVIEVKYLGKSNGAVLLEVVMCTGREGDHFVLIHGIKIILPDGTSVDGPLLDHDDSLYFLQEFGEYFLAVGPDGSIYHLWIRRQGPKVIKWQREG